MLKSIGIQAFTGINSVFFLASYDQKNQANLMALNFLSPCSTQPPCLAVSIQKSNYSHSLIRHNNAFTLNLATTKLAKELDLAGLLSGQNDNKLARLNLDLQSGEHVHAPYLLASPLVIECTVINSLDFASHTLFIAEILDLRVAEDCLNSQQEIISSKLDSLLYCSQNYEYSQLGSFVGRAFALGKTLITTKSTFDKNEDLE